MTGATYLSIAFTIIIIGGCTNNNQQSVVSAKRETVSKKPVASYIIPMGDPKLDRKFGVEIFETPETFKFFLQMYDDGIVHSDTLIFPDFGISPVIQIKPGTEKLSCIIGFLDNKKTFREYKMLSEKNGEFLLTTLKRYYINTPKQ